MMYIIRNFTAAGRNKRLLSNAKCRNLIFRIFPKAPPGSSVIPMLLNNTTSNASGPMSAPLERFPSGLLHNPMTFRFTLVVRFGGA